MTEESFEQLCQLLCDERGRPLLVYVRMEEPWSEFPFGEALADLRGDELDLLIIDRIEFGAEHAMPVINALQGAAKKLTAIVPFMASGLGGVLALTCDEILLSDVGFIGEVRARPGGAHDDLARPGDLDAKEAMEAISAFNAREVRVARDFVLQKLRPEVPQDRLPGLALKLANLLSEPLLESISPDSLAREQANYNANWQYLVAALNESRARLGGQRDPLFTLARELLDQPLNIRDSAWLQERGFPVKPMPGGRFGELVHEMFATVFQLERDGLFLMERTEKMPSPTRAARKAPRLKVAKSVKKPQRGSRTKSGAGASTRRASKKT